MGIHTGVGHTPTVSQHSNFDSEKLSQMFLVLQMGFEPVVFGSGEDALPTEPRCHLALLFSTKARTEVETDTSGHGFPPDSE